jgi:hypothetical protein
MGIIFQPSFLKSIKRSFPIAMQISTRYLQFWEGEGVGKLSAA